MPEHSTKQHKMPAGNSLREESISSLRPKFPEPLLAAEFQVKGFLQSGLYRSTDLVELRAIETWTGGGKKKTRLVQRNWLSPDEILERLPSIQAINADAAHAANIFVSVNPRTSHSGGTKDAVREVRSVWADLDIHDLVRRLDVRVTDRSARDFAIMCELLRRGLLESDIYALVIDRSKFGTNGGDYFRHTFENARRATGDELS